jgi:hypothetical protein
VIHRSIVSLSALVVLVVSSSARAQESAALTALAAQLQQARALPAGTPTHLACPSDMNQFVGLTRTILSKRLGDADYVMDGRDENPPQPQMTVSYFLKSPGHANPGTTGGYPMLTFYVGSADVIERASCSLSK